MWKNVKYTNGVNERLTLGKIYEVIEVTKIFQNIPALLIINDLGEEELISCNYPGSHTIFKESTIEVRNKIIDDIIR